MTDQRDLDAMRREWTIQEGKPMNRITEYLCIATLTISLVLLCAMLEERLRPAPDVAEIKSLIQSLEINSDIEHLTPVETPVAIAPEEVK
jgi:hypothetical protein